MFAGLGQHDFFDLGVGRRREFEHGRFDGPVGDRGGGQFEHRRGALGGVDRRAQRHAVGGVPRELGAGQQAAAFLGRHAYGVGGLAGDVGGGRAGDVGVLFEVGDRFFDLGHAGDFVVGVRAGGAADEPGQPSPELSSRPELGRLPPAPSFGGV